MGWCILVSALLAIVVSKIIVTHHLRKIDDYIVKVMERTETSMEEISEMLNKHF